MMEYKSSRNQVTRFLAEYRIKMRQRQRNKRTSKAHKEADLKKWHATLRERCIRFGKDETYDEKWGRFKPAERLNVDQSPLPFVIDVKRTYEYVESGSKNHDTWIAQPGSGLDKRQCTLQVAFRPEGNQPRLAIIFRGKGKRISQDEKLTWHSGVDVYFQLNAWMDTKVCCEWGERSSIAGLLKVQFHLETTKLLPSIVAPFGVVVKNAESAKKSADINLSQQKKLLT